MSSFRFSPSVMALGEAAGVTAGLASMNGCTVASVDPKAVQNRLRETGGILN
jgi:FAD dependent oxidoreductase